MLNVGDSVPDFTLPLVTADGKRDPVSFHQFLKQGNGPVVIGFFPMAFTTPCTKEMCEFRDRQAVFDHVHARGLGFSVDTPFVAIAFAKENKLNHPIFVDPNFKVVDQVWQTMTVAGVEKRAKRGWMVVTPEGKVAAKWVSDDPGVWSGIDPINAALHKAFPHAH